MRKFDFYEFVGFLVPGTLLLVGMAFVWSDSTTKLVGQGVSLGDFGVAVIVAYAVGHLVQAVGNLMEKIWWWFFGGMPTDWVRAGKYSLLSPDQVARVELAVRRLLGDDTFKLGPNLDRKAWYSISREIYSVVASTGRAARVDMFNGNYGLSRGIAAALLLLLVAVMSTHWSAWRIEVLLGVLAGLALYRMRLFAVHYGRELFVEFIRIQGEKNVRGT